MSVHVLKLNTKHTVNTLLCFTLTGILKESTNSSYFLKWKNRETGKNRSHIFQEAVEELEAGEGSRGQTAKWDLC